MTEGVGVSWRGLRGSRFAREVATLSGATAVALAVGALQGLVTARVLGPHAYGVVGLVVAAPAFVHAIVGCRMVDVGVRYLTEFAARAEFEKARAFCKLGYLLEMTVGFLAVAVVAALGNLIERHVVGEPGTRDLMVLLAAATALRSPASTSAAVLRALGSLRAAGALQAAPALVRAALVLLALAAGLGVPGVVTATALALAAEGGMALYLGSRAIRLAWGGGWLSAPLTALRARRRDIARFLVWSDLAGMLGLVTKQADVLAVGAFASATAAGHYRLAVSMASLASVVVGPLQAVLFQRFARLRGVGDAAGLRRAARRVAGMVCLPLGLLLLTALPFVPLLVRVLVGDAYRPAAAPAQISLAAVAVWLALAWVRPLAFAVDAVKAWAAGAAAVAAVSLAGFVVLTPMLGALGPAWVRLGTGTAMQAAFAVRLGRRHVAILPGRPAMRGDIPAAPGPRGAR